MLCGFVLSLLIELTQLVTHLGMFDLDDLMNNSLGAFLGRLCFTPPFAYYLQSLNKWLLK